MVFKQQPLDTVTTKEFENDVKIYGIQTHSSAFSCSKRFENDVKIYGIQTDQRFEFWQQGLRMM